MAWKETDTESTPGVTYEREVEGPKDHVDLGDHFYALHEKCKGNPSARTEEALYFAITRRPGTLRDRGERKIHRVLPSGKEVRIWREGEAKKHPMLRQKMEGDKDHTTGSPTNRHLRDEKERHEYTLEARDAVFLARHPNVFIEPTRLRVEAPAGVYAPDQVCQKCGGPPLQGKKGFDHLDKCPYSKK